MSAKPPFRPWGALEWALGLSSPRRWRFFGCVSAEQRSISALMALHRMDVIERVEMLRILDLEFGPTYEARGNRRVRPKKHHAAAKIAPERLGRGFSHFVTRVASGLKSDKLSARMAPAHAS